MHARTHRCTHGAIGHHNQRKYKGNHGSFGAEMCSVIVAESCVCAHHISLAHARAHMCARAPQTNIADERKVTQTSVPLEALKIHRLHTKRASCGSPSHFTLLVVNLLVAPRKIAARQPRACSMKSANRAAWPGFIPTWTATSCRPALVRLIKCCKSSKLPRARRQLSVQNALGTPLATMQE